jgi:broad specificity phosphatase PhoE
MVSSLNKTTYCTLYLVRHGETVWNVNHRIQGQLDSELTENGVLESKKQAQKLKDIQFDGIFSSDLSRAAKTAEILKLDRKLAIATHKALRERTFGKYDGSFGDKYTKAIQNLLEKYEKLTENERWKFKFDEGYESDEELVTRFITILREIAVGYLGKTILVVTHGGNLRTFLTHLGFAAHGELKPGTFKNAGYVKVRCDGADFFLDGVEGVDKSQGINTKTL